MLFTGHFLAVGRGTRTMSQTPQRETNRDGGGETKTRRNAILAEQNPLAIIDSLPPAVFPVTCRFGVPRGREQDHTDDTYQQPTHPVDLHHSTGVYVPETTVHFDNPARRPPDGEAAWRPDNFATRVAEILDDVDGLTEKDIVLSRFTVVEVPQHLATTDSETGAPAVKPELYAGENEITIAQFRKHNSLSAAHVRHELSDALPGESRTPARLTDLWKVTAKPSRHGSHTTATSGRARFYTEAEAEKTGDLDRTPAHYQSRYVNRESERTRPLGPTVSNLASFLPELLQNTDELVRVVKFIGHEQERQSFVATEVRE